MNDYTLVINIDGTHFSATIQAQNDAIAIDRSKALAHRTGEDVILFLNSADPFGPSQPIAKVKADHVTT